MAGWRLLRLETHSAFRNMAIDEAILTARIGDLVPNTVRFYRWKPSAVSIGRFQRIKEEVELDNCRKDGVDVVRRISGGGTVYHDAGDEITYSVVADKKDLKAHDIIAVYAKIYAGLAEAVKILGLKVDFDEGDLKACPNLMVRGRKISGSAQYYRRGVVLQHGTLLIDVNLERMFAFLRVPWARTCMEVVGVAEHRITSIKKELGREVSMGEMKEALVEGFQRSLNVKLVKSGLGSYERELSEQLYREKYTVDDWNFMV